MSDFERLFLCVAVFGFALLIWGVWKSEKVMRDYREQERLRSQYNKEVDDGAKRE